MLLKRIFRDTFIRLDQTLWKPSNYNGGIPPTVDKNGLVLQMTPYHTVDELGASEIYSRFTFPMPKQLVFRFKYRIVGPAGQPQDEIAAFVTDDTKTWDKEEFGLVAPFTIDANSSTRAYVQYNQAGAKQFIWADPPIQYPIDWHDYAGQYYYDEGSQKELFAHSIDGATFFEFSIPVQNQIPLFLGKNFTIILTVHHKSKSTFNVMPEFHVTNLELIQVL